MRVYSDNYGGWTTEEPASHDFTAYPDSHFLTSIDVVVSDFRLSAWIQFLADSPHHFEGSVKGVCDRCNDLFNEFHGKQVF